jgi:hypothetical protein
MFGDAYPYKEGEITVLPDDDAILSMKEKVKGKEPLLAKNLFWYRHNEHGTFVVAEWIGRPYLYYIDKINLGKRGMQGLTKEKFDEFLRRALNPLSAQEMERITAEEEYKFLMMQQEENELEKERLEKVARGE